MRRLPEKEGLFQGFPVCFSIQVEGVMVDWEF